MKKFVLLALALFLLPVMAGAQVLNIGGHRAPLDSLNYIWLCSVPQATFGTDYAAQVTYGDELTDLVIEGVSVAAGDIFEFQGIEGGKQYTVTAHLGDSLITGAITFTWLPVVELNGRFNNYYKEGTVTVSEPDSAFAEPMRAKLKWRGIATNTAAKNKRNYRIKFLTEDSTKMNRRFFGLRNDNCWILDAGQMDFLRVRNRVSTDLWLDMARKPWYADSIKNVHNGSRGQMVEVLLNGKYVGIYNMCEPIDRKQLKLERYEPQTQTFHGQLWMAYKWSQTVSMSQPIPRSTGVRDWDGIEVKYPDPDEIRLVRWTAMEKAVKFAKRADEDRSLVLDSLGYFFDLPVMEDYLIFIAALQALDNESKNIYYACHDFQTNSRLTMVPWDLDICLGQNYSPEVDMPEMVQPERGLDWILHIPMICMMDEETYWEEIKARYKELRETYLSTENLVNRYRSAIDELEDCGAAAREEGRWSGDTDLFNKTLDLSAEMDYVEDWIRRHMEYLDNYVFTDNPGPGPGPDPEPLRGDVNGDGEVNVADVNMLIDIVMGGNDVSEGRSDVNGDGEVNVANINEVINIILS